MAPKRVAAASPKGRGRPAKAAKVAEPEPEQETGLTCVAELLSEIDVSQSCADMLKGALPHAVGTAPSERHAFQKTVIDTFKGLYAEAEKAGEAAVRAAEARIVSLESEKAACGEKLAEAEKAAEEKAAAKVASEKAEKEAEEALAAAQAAAKAAAQEEQEKAKDVEAQITAKAAFEQQFADNFNPLKTGRFTGKEWNIRNKAIKQVVALLEQGAAPASLIAAVQLALKDKPDARSAFGVKAVDAAEDAIKACIEQLQGFVSSKQEAAASQREAVASADEAVKAASEKLEAAQETMISAENAWLECDAVAKEAKKTLQDVEKADPKSDLDSATASLEQLLGLIRSFEQVEEHAEGGSVEAVKEAAASPEAVAA